MVSYASFQRRSSPATSAFLVPPSVLGLAKHPLVAIFDLSNMRVIVSGAAPLSGELEQAVNQRLSCAVVQGYGMTAVSPVTHLLKAFVVLKGEATEEEIMQFVAENAAPFKKVRYVEFVAQIPKSASGKILRHMLKEQE